MLKTCLIDTSSGFSGRTARRSRDIVLSVISGDDFFYNRAQSRRVPLWPRLLRSNVRNARPSLKLEELSASLERLESANVVTRDGGFGS